MKLRHIGIVVQNMEKMIDFYTTLFNEYEIVADTIEQGKYIDNLLGVKDIKLRIIKIMNDYDSSIIELLSPINYKIDSLEKSMFRAGLTHIAFTVRHIEDLVRCLKKDCGAKFLSETQTNENNTAKVVYCEDPEGNFIELVEEINVSTNTK